MNRVVILETMRRHFTSLPALAYLGLLVIMSLASSRLETLLWPPLVKLLALAAGAGLIGPEFSSGTLQLILVKPINRAVYLVSRFTGVVLFLAIAAGLCFAAETAGRLIWGDMEPMAQSALLLLNVTAETALICALLAFFGTFLRAYFNVALYWLIVIVLASLKGLFVAARLATGGFMGWLRRMLAEYPVVEKSIDWLGENLFPDASPSFDRHWLLMVWSNVVIAIVLACLVFRRREVPYGAD